MSGRHPFSFHPAPCVLSCCRGHRTGRFQNCCPPPGPRGGRRVCITAQRRGGRRPHRCAFPMRKSHYVALSVVGADLAQGATYVRRRLKRSWHGAPRFLIRSCAPRCPTSTPPSSARCSRSGHCFLRRLHREPTSPSRCGSCGTDARLVFLGSHPCVPQPDRPVPGTGTPTRF
jgi:hypothetical protein